MKLTLKSSLLASVAVAALLAGCWNKGTEEGTGNVVAKVNGQPIRESQLTQQLAAIPADLLKGREAEVKTQILEGLIQQAVIMQEANKRNVSKTTEYQDQMRTITKQLSTNVLLALKVSDTVTPAAVQAAYDAQKATIGYPAVKAKHILVATEAEARDLIKIATPANFSELARQKSTGPTKESGGELGWFKKEMMVPAFAEVAFSSPIGVVATQPVKTQFGWHVILVEDRQAAYTPPLAEVENEIRQQLSQEVVQGYLKELRTAAKVEYSDGMAPASPTTVQ